ncbi:MAG: DUF998 domain-containing protein [Bowdeniella nasicola]|nr:DUF998 domain-containing protein [Bowdeniella nasicola]
MTPPLLSRAALSAWLTAAAGLLYLSWVVGDCVVPLPLATSFTSEYAAGGQPGAHFFRLADGGSGALLTVAGALLWRLLCSSRARWGALALTGWGLSTIVDAISPMSCSPHGTPSCVLTVDSFATAPDIVHVISSSLATVCAVLAVVLLTGVRPLAIAVVAATIAVTAIAGLHEIGISLPVGYVQRAQLLLLSCWAMTRPWAVNSWPIIHTAGHATSCVEPTVQKGEK